MDIHALTRELHVKNDNKIVMLVADGLANQQIAERLYLSVRTVETHLSRVFTKIGVSSRVGVATAMNRSK